MFTIDLGFIFSARNEWKMTSRQHGKIEHLSEVSPYLQYGCLLRAPFADGSILDKFRGDCFY